MKRLFFVFLSVVSAAAAPIAFYDTNGVVRAVESRETMTMTNAPGALIVQPAKYWKAGVTNYGVVDGELAPGLFKVTAGGTNFVRLVRRTTEEIDAEASAVASAQASAAEAALLGGARGGVTNDVDQALALRAAVSVLVDEINVLRTELNQAKTNAAAWRNAPTLNLRTMHQAKTAILNRIEDGGAR